MNVKLLVWQADTQCTVDYGCRSNKSKLCSYKLSNKHDQTKYSAKLGCSFDPFDNLRKYNRNKVENYRGLKTHQYGWSNPLRPDNNHSMCQNLCLWVSMPFHTSQDAIYLHVSKHCFRRNRQKLSVKHKQISTVCNSERVSLMVKVKYKYLLPRPIHWPLL